MLKSRPSRLAALLLFAAAAACAQSNVQGPAKTLGMPQTLADLTGKYRPLLIFAPGPTDPRYVHQMEIIDSSPALTDRNVVLVPIFINPSNCSGLLIHNPYMCAGTNDASTARQRYHVEDADFRVILIGKDGSAKVTSVKAVTLEQLNIVIDSMPGRKQELQDRPKVPNQPISPN